MRSSDWSSDGCSSDLPHHRAEPQQITSARGQHAFYRTTQRIGHARGYIRKEGADTRHAVLCPPENRRSGRRDNEEGKKRHQRKIGKVARMNEAISKDADGQVLEIE